MVVLKNRSQAWGGGIPKAATLHMLHVPLSLTPKFCTPTKGLCSLASQTDPFLFCNADRLPHTESD